MWLVNEPLLYFQVRVMCTKAHFNLIIQVIVSIDNDDRLTRLIKHIFWIQGVMRRGNLFKKVD